MGYSYGLNLNTGSYYGNGGTGVIGSTLGKTASSVNINRMSTDITAGFDSDLQIIAQYMKKGETDRAIRLYENLFDDVQETAALYNYELSDSHIKTILNNAYTKATGSTMTAAIEKNTSGSFASGLAQGLPIVGLFLNGTTNDEALSALSNEKPSVKSKISEYLGAIASGAASGAAIGGVASAGTFLIPGAIIGGVWGAAQTLIKDLL